MAELKKYLDTTALGTLVDQIKAEDAKVLAAAKKYTDEASYDVAGSAATAESNAKAYTDELANGQVKTNKEDIATLKGTGEGSVAKAVADAKALIDADVDAVEVIANKNKEDIAAINNADTGILAQAKAYADAEDAKVEKEVADLKTYVGTIPTDATATDIVGYVQEKTAGIATDAALTELTDRVTQAETDIDNIEKDYLKAADKKELADAIKAEEDRAKGIESGLETRVKAVEDDYLKKADKDALQGAIDGVAGDVATIKGDYLKAADKTELEGKIDVKAAQTALDAEIERATGIEGGLRTDVDAIKADYLKASDKTELQGNIDTLAGVVETLSDGIDPDKVDGVKDLIKYVEDHGPEVTGMKEDIADNAKAIADHEALAAETYETKADATDKLAEAKGYTDTAKAAVIGTSEDASTANTVYGAKKYAEEKATAAKEAAEATAAGALESAKTELEGKINAKADASVVEALDTAYKAADTELSGRLDAVEAQLGDGEGSVADMIADAKAELQGEISAAKDEAIAEAATAASNKDAVVLSEAQKYTDGEIDKVEVRVAELETASATHALASDLTALAGRVTTAEGEIDTLQTEMDAVEALAAANKAAHEANAAAIALKASQADLEAAVARVAQNETDIEALEGAVATKAAQSDLEAAVARITKNETDIAANTSAINSFVAISSAEVEALFA